MTLYIELTLGLREEQSKPAPLPIVEHSPHSQPDILLYIFMMHIRGLISGSILNWCSIPSRCHLPRSRPLDVDFTPVALMGATNLTPNLVLTICTQKSEVGWLPIQIAKYKLKSSYRKKRDKRKIERFLKSYSF